MSKIRIYTDESVNVSIAEGLKRRGVDSFSARDSDNLGLSDEEQIAYALSQQATIFTHDIDFLRIASRFLGEGKTFHGVIYCHQHAYSIGKCIRKLRTLVTMLSHEDMINHIEFL